MLLFVGIVITALATALVTGAAVTFILLSFMRAAPVLAARTGRSVDVVVVGGPSWPQRSGLRPAPRPGSRVRVLGGALQPA